MARHCFAKRNDKYQKRLIDGSDTVPLRSCEADCDSVEEAETSVKLKQKGRDVQGRTQESVFTTKSERLLVLSPGRWLQAQFRRRSQSRDTKLKTCLGSTGIQLSQEAFRAHRARQMQQQPKGDVPLLGSLRGISLCFWT